MGNSVPNAARLSQSRKGLGLAPVGQLTAGNSVPSAEAHQSKGIRRIQMAVVSYKCPNCDGELVFNPRTQKYKCEYCTSAFSQEELSQMQPGQQEGRQESASFKGAGGEEGNVYGCPSCGAQIVTDDTTAASFCYYCHNPVVLSGRVSGEFMPHKIIPFAIDKRQATEKFLEYVQHKKFVPRAFFCKSQIEKISGVYFPYWMVDMDLEGSMEAEGKHIRVWRSGDTEYTETRLYQVERAGDIHLEDLTKNALKKANSKLSAGVLPYDMAKAQEFHMGYLSGFLAEKRDIEQGELETEVRAEAKEYGEKLLKSTIHGYTTLSVKGCRLNRQRENWEYVLLPVWTVTYKGRDGKFYYYSMNGQNGKVYGELPIDLKKVWILSGIVSVTVFLLGLIGGFFI